LAETAAALAHRLDEQLACTCGARVVAIVNGMRPSSVSRAGLMELVVFVGRNVMTGIASPAGTLPLEQPDVTFAIGEALF
jgi:hypothetical protein